jgi:oxygen-dependent protoporphyrinogen oxidase
VSGVVVVGAGITGLTAAYRLLAHDGERPEVVVLEAEDRVGGKIASATVGGVELEAGPDSLLGRKPWGVELCRELGLGGDLVASAPVPTHIWTDAGLLRFPSGPFGITTDPWELWRWPGMSRRGKVRAAADLVLRSRRETSDESLGALLRRRIGDEATETLVAPLLGGLFAGDVDRMSVAHAHFGSARADVPQAPRRAGADDRCPRGAGRARADPDVDPGDRDPSRGRRVRRGGVA